MHHPACWIVFSVTTALLFIPGTLGGSLFPPWGASQRLEQKRNQRGAHEEGV